MGVDGSAEFSIDAVARKADVTRMTVYYQFGGKGGLLEAVFDELAAEGEIAERLPRAFQQTDPEAALDLLVAAFAHFWASNRTVIRRIRNLAALDPELGHAHAARDQRRLDAARVIVGRIGTGTGRGASRELEERADLLHALTSFEMYDNLAEKGRPLKDILASLQRLSRAAVGLKPPD